MVQWRTQSVQGVSRWLFVGQLSASAGFLAYSWLLANWVFVFTNAALLATAIAGEAIYQRNVRVTRLKRHDATQSTARRSAGG